MHTEAICLTDISGIKRWYLNGVVHREDGPAVIIPGSIEYWFRNGNIHREDGPAIEFPNDHTKNRYSSSVYNVSFQ